MPQFILFWNDILHVSDGLSVHHQEFKTVHTATGICQTDTADYVLASSQQYLFGCCMYRVIQNDCRGTIAQQQFRTTFGKQPPSDNSIRRWYAQFQAIGCVCIPEMKVQIRTAIETITADMWNELDYRVDVCRITKGAHIEYL